MPGRSKEALKTPVGGNGWLAANPSKRWCELFFLAYSPVWISALLCVTVPFRIYEVCPVCLLLARAQLDGSLTRQGLNQLTIELTP